MKASGILFVTKQGKALFLKRSVSGDHPGEWCIPGGKLEPPEDLANCAIRETFEETGQQVPITAIREFTTNLSPAPTPVIHNEMGAVADPTEREGVEFTTFLTDASEEFVPHLCHEHEAFAWAPVDSPPEPLHPGCRITLRRFGMNELDIARSMAAGELASPQKYQNVCLWAMRITGTGESYRDKLEEYVWRDPRIYMNQEMLDRLKAIPIVMEHPKEEATLNSDEFHDRVVGTMQWPYLVPEAEEVWGITRIYDDATNLLLFKGQEEGRPLSTSPSVTLGLRSGSQKIRLEDGSPLLIEGKPTYIDHLAICYKGVWDKGGDPAGVQLNDSQGDSAMPDFGEKIDKLLTAMDAMGTRMDALEKRYDDDDDTKSRRRKDDDDDDAKKKDASSRSDDDDDDDAKKRKDESEEKEEKEEKVADRKDDDDDDDAKSRRRKDDDDDDARKARGRKDDDDDDSRRRRKDDDDDDDARRARRHAKDSSRSDDDDDDDAKRRRKDDDDDDDSRRRGRKDGLKEFARGMSRKDDDDDDDDSRRRRKDDDDDDDRKDSRNDSSLHTRLRRVEKALPRQLTDSDYHAITEAQSRADSVYGALGIGRAPIPLNGEDLNGYRRRVATKLKEHSSRWGKTNLYNIQADAFDNVENDIYNDAMAAALSPDDVPEGSLRSIVKHDLAGRPITEYVGEPIAWMSQFGGFKRRLSGIRTERNY